MHETIWGSALIIFPIGLPWLLILPAKTIMRVRCLLLLKRSRHALHWHDEPQSLSFCASFIFFVIKFYVGHQWNCRLTEYSLIWEVSKNSWFQIGLSMKPENCRNVRAIDGDRGQPPRDRMIWPPECTLHKDKDLCLFCTLIYSKCLEQCLVCSRCSINHGGEAERMGQWEH